MTPMFLLLAAGLSPGQPPAASVPRAAAADARAVEMVEDVEVMRRILNRAVGLPNEPATLAGLQTTFNPMHNDFGSQNLYPLGGPSYYFGNQTTRVYKLADPFDGV